MTRLRFSIRDLLWLTALVAVIVAWWIDRGRLTPYRDRIEEQEAAAKKIQQNIPPYIPAYDDQEEP